ncbi:prostaglandin reductase 1-like [Haliotis cracherodii]|uniref:prostaglandin reductase 1-like n=1 Tax=Haliotis cracherodii TaxID=6455 RepID=UPI0039EB5051
MVQARKWIYAHEFEDQPRTSNLQLVTENISDALQDEEVLCEAVFLSVDPYMRLFKVAVGDVMQGEQVARVTASKSDSFPVGTMILAKLGWRTHTIVSDTSILEQLPPLGELSASLALGAVGMPGMTAYFGVEDVLKPVEGETVLVNAAAGAVGSVVGQIAKIKGCKVIGYAGTKEKCDWLKNELGFDAVFNYKETTVSDSIKEAAPEGVDCYFDNVGGEFSSTVLFNMKQGGRVAVCGQIAEYRYDGKPQTGPLVYGQMLAKQLTMRGFMCRTFQHWPEAKLQVIDWIKQGKIKYRETVTEGFENMAEAFVGLFHGANTGKAIVKV